VDPRTWPRSERSTPTGTAPALPVAANARAFVGVHVFVIVLVIAANVWSAWTARSFGAPLAAIFVAIPVAAATGTAATPAFIHAAVAVAIEIAAEAAFTVCFVLGLVLIDVLVVAVPGPSKAGATALAARVAERSRGRARVGAVRGLSATGTDPYRRRQPRQPALTQCDSHSLASRVLQHRGIAIDPGPLMGGGLRFLHRRAEKEV
jgi:hypothetical protein